MLKLILRACALCLVVGCFEAAPTANTTKSKYKLSDTLLYVEPINHLDYSNSEAISLYPIHEDKKGGYIDEKGNKIIPLQYYSAWSFTNNRALVYINKTTYTYIKPNGQAIDAVFTGDGSLFCNNFATNFDPKTRLLQAIDTSGKVVYSTVLNKNSHYDSYDDYIDILNKSGKVIKHTTISSAKKVCSNLRLIEYKDAEGRMTTKGINTKNDTVFRVKGRVLSFRFMYAILDSNAYYTNIEQASSNPAMADYGKSKTRYRRLGESWIDTNGRVLRTLPKDWLSKKYRNGYYCIGGANNPQGLADKYNNIILEPKYKFVIFSEAANIAVVKTYSNNNKNPDKLAVYNMKKARFVTPFQYDDVKAVKGRLALVTQNGKLMYINEDGKQIWQEK